jgi:multidrug efflux pump subunit AcrB
MRRHTPQLPQDRIGFEELSYGAIRRWRMVLVGALGLLLVAWMAWLKIPRLEDPKVETAEAGVTLIYPGASPEDVESQVLKPVEEVLYGLDDIEWIESSATPNVAFFHLKFDDATNMDVMVEKIRGKVQAKKKDLPAEVKDPEVIRYATSRTPQMMVALVGNRSLEVLTDGAKRMKDNLNTVPGVAGIDLVGDSKPAVRVRLDPLKLKQHRLTPEQVVRQLQLANVRIPGGELEVGNLSTLLQVNQEFKGAADVMKMPVGASADGKGGSRTIALGDVADVRDAYLQQKVRYIVKGQPAVALAVKFRSGENAVAVGEAVRKKLHEIEGSFPHGTTLQIAHDQPKWISKSISDFLESLAEGIVLVMGIITLGMGWRSAVVVSGVLPLAAGGAIFGLYAGGFALEQVSIAGLIVALGLLVDDAVVVTESISVMRDKGLSSLRAAVLGTARVFWANNGTTAVAIASFLPLFFMGGSTGLFIKGLPTAVILALATSLVVAQLFTPWASTVLLPKPKEVPDLPDDAPFAREDDSADPEHGERNAAIKWMKDWYRRNIPWVMANPLKVVVTAVALLVASLMLLPKIGFEFFPKAEKPAFFVLLELPKGTRLETTAAKATQALELLHQDPAVEDTSATVGSGYPQIFLGRLARRQGSDIADILVRLKKGEDSGVVAPRVRQKLQSIPGINVVTEELWHGPPVAHPILIRVFGDDYTKLRAYAEEVKAQLRALEGTVNVSDSLTESVPLTKVALDSDRALRTGLTPGQVGGTLRWLHGEDKATEFRRGEDQVQVVLDPVPAPDRPLAAVEETPVQSARGSLVPLREAGRVDLGYGYAELKRRNTRRVVEITSDVEGGVLPNDLIAKIDPWLRAKKWDTGYGFAYAGAQEETAKSFRNLGIAAMGAVVIIFLLLVLMFDSITLATVVMSAVPFVMIGAVTGLALTGNPFGFMAFLGLIALIGVYVNHKIYFVDRMRELMLRGEDLLSAVTHAGTDRLRPVVLTALTAVLGLVPLTLGGGRLWGAFGWVNIFGLMASIPLSLILLPALVALAFRFERRSAVKED